jgi:hypothetical protein
MNYGSTGSGAGTTLEKFSFSNEIEGEQKNSKTYPAPTLQCNATVTFLTPKLIVLDNRFKTVQGQIQDFFTR